MTPKQLTPTLSHVAAASMAAMQRQPPLQDGGSMLEASQPRSRKLAALDRLSLHMPCRSCMLGTLLLSV